MSAKILLVDDDPNMCAMLGRTLAKKGFRTASALNGQAALDAVEHEEFDAVVTDLNMKGMDGIVLCQRLAELRPDLPVIVVTAFGSLETAVRAIRAGAYDFITKPIEFETLEIALARAIQHRALRQEVTRLRVARPMASPSDELLGESSAMHKVFELLARIADSEVSVLITGETGTGKELIANAVHRRSRRVGRPFVAVNLTAVPESLLESELFGHVKGAFTDARQTRKGLFQQAHGGTLFLDEIGDLPLALQPKLLRVLQERTVRPVGADQDVAVDVRIVSATHRDLESMVEEHAFREDLYYRLNVVGIEVPPLRSRGGDVLLLAQHFLQEAAQRAGKGVTGLSPEAASRLLAYGWPGNVRELANCMERAVALTRLSELAPDDLPEKVRDYRRSHVVVAADDPEELVTMDELERRYITRVMELVHGNKTRAADILGYDRKRLYRKLEKYGLAAASSGTE